MVYKNCLFQLLISFLILQISVSCSGQKNDLQSDQILFHELAKVNNSKSLIKFLTDHAANYEDFDSLYSALEGKPCPNGLTYNLINGDSSEQTEVSKSFIYLVARNFLRPPLDKDVSQIKNIDDLLMTPQVAFTCPSEMFINAMKIISGDIKNQISFKIDSVKIVPALMTSALNEKLIVKNNIRSWGRNLDKMNWRDFKPEYKRQLESSAKYGLIVLHVEQKTRWENRFHSQIRNQDQSFLKMI